MNRQEIEAQVRSDYDQFAGKIVRASHLIYFLNNDSHELFVPEGALVRVEKGQSDFVVWNEEYCDPVWNVEPVDVPNLPAGVTSCWIHGISYRIGFGKTNDRHPEIVKD